MSEFDSKARGWDKESVHWERSKAIADRMLKGIPARKGMKALEYGAGTGILSFMLSDLFEEITLMDNSPEMIKVIQEKVAASKSAHLKPVLFNLEQTEYNFGSFDCIFTQMAMHHVSDIDLVLERFYRILNPGGLLFIADLYAEDGSFHGEGFTGHNGFDVEQLKARLLKKGFVHTTTEQCFIMKKATGDIVREYPVFLMIAEKP
ncbi:class I SAM-dependent methyltransferase [Bacteroides sedimenti]|uniref:S-adenosylmethionine-dependent methyltransferase n=1 Tax=Bacteroides sedimenti TaxID=2136147 RepID=A0ABN6Z4W1_9BACE